MCCFYSKLLSFKHDILYLLRPWIFYWASKNLSSHDLLKLLCNTIDLNSWLSVGNSTWCKFGCWCWGTYLTWWFLLLVGCPPCSSSTPCWFRIFMEEEKAGAFLYVAMVLGFLELFLAAPKSIWGCYSWATSWLSFELCDYAFHAKLMQFLDDILGCIFSLVLGVRRGLVYSLLGLDDDFIPCLLLSLLLYVENWGCLGSWAYFSIPWQQCDVLIITYTLLVKAKILALLLEFF